MRRSKRDKIEQLVHGEKVSHRETQDTEKWWVEVKTTRWGYEAIGKSSHDRLLGGAFDGWNGMPMWRPTESWARRAVERVIRRYLANQRLREDQDANARIYPVHG